MAGNQIERLLLAVHPVPYEAADVKHYMSVWAEFLREQADDDATALCLLTNEAPGIDRLTGLAEDCFGERCFVDPSDDGEQTMQLIAADLMRTMQERGSRTQWLPYEIWTSSNARMWAEGLRHQMRERGYSYQDGRLSLRAFGQQWQGCLTKYALFFGKYSGIGRPAEVLPDLSPGAGFPLQATWKESHLCAHDVWLHLFETEDGRPMGQYTDGLRGVWETPHQATVLLPSADVELISWSPNAFIQAGGAAANRPESVVMDVGDGCHGDFSTLVGTRVALPQFRAAMLHALIEDRPHVAGVYHAIPYLVPATMSRDRAPLPAPKDG